jgi:hypothetical protein
MFHSLRDWMEALPDALNPKQPPTTSDAACNSGSLHKCEPPPDGSQMELRVGLMFCFTQTKKIHIYVVRRSQSLFKVDH